MPRSPQKPRLCDLEREFQHLIPRAEIKACWMENDQDTIQTRLELQRMSRNVQETRQKPVVIQNKNYDGKVGKLRKEVAELYKAKAKTNLPRLHREAIQTEIDQKIRAWNTDNSALSYYDLHGMSRDGALRYAKEMVEKAKEKGVKELKFETGRGNHSRDRVPAIKVALLKHFGSSEELTVELEPKNDGVLIVKLH